MHEYIYDLNFTELGDDPEEGILIGKTKCIRLPSAVMGMAYLSDGNASVKIRAYLHHDTGKLQATLCRIAGGHLPPGLHLSGNGTFEIKGSSDYPLDGSGEGVYMADLKFTFCAKYKDKIEWANKNAQVAIALYASVGREIFCLPPAKNTFEPENADVSRHVTPYRYTAPVPDRVVKYLSGPLPASFSVISSSEGSEVDGENAGEDFPINGGSRDYEFAAMAKDAFDEVVKMQLSVEGVRGFNESVTPGQKFDLYLSISESDVILWKPPFKILSISQPIPGKNDISSSHKSASDFISKINIEDFSRIVGRVDPKIELNIDDVRGFNWADYYVGISDSKGHYTRVPLTLTVRRTLSSVPAKAFPRCYKFSSPFREGVEGLTYIDVAGFSLRYLDESGEIVNINESKDLVTDLKYSLEMDGRIGGGGGFPLKLCDNGESLYLSGNSGKNTGFFKFYIRVKSQFRKGLADYEETTQLQKVIIRSQAALHDFHMPTVEVGEVVNWTPLFQDHSLYEGAMVYAGELPPGLRVDESHLIWGSPTKVGSYKFATLVFASTLKEHRQFLISIDVTPSKSIIAKINKFRVYVHPNSHHIFEDLQRYISGKRAINIEISKECSRRIERDGFFENVGLEKARSYPDGTGFVMSVKTKPFCHGTYPIELVVTFEDGSTQTEVAFITVVEPSEPIPSTPGKMPSDFKPSSMGIKLRLNDGGHPAKLGSPYSGKIIVEGGQGKVVFEVIDGKLPCKDGLTKDGIISCVPDVLGYFSFLVKVIDLKGNVGYGYFVINVEPGIVINPVESVLPEAFCGGQWPSVQFTAKNATPPVSFKRVGSPLPDGMKLSEDGKLSGIPKEPGLFKFDVVATDGLKGVAKRTYHIIVDIPMGKRSFHTMHYGQRIGTYSLSEGVKGGPFHAVKIVSVNAPKALRLCNAELVGGEWQLSVEFNEKYYGTIRIKYSLKNEFIYSNVGEIVIYRKK